MLLDFLRELFKSTDINWIYVENFTKRTHGIDEIRHVSFWNCLMILFSNSWMTAKNYFLEENNSVTICVWVLYLLATVL